MFYLLQHETYQSIWLVECSKRVYLLTQKLEMKVRAK